ncbi:MAG: hypothetical protein RL215_2557 [Planctomycetota bacterium]
MFQEGGFDGSTVFGGGEGPRGSGDGEGEELDAAEEFGGDGGGHRALLVALGAFVAWVWGVEVRSGCWRSCKAVFE